MVLPLHRGRSAPAARGRRWRRGARLCHQQPALEDLHRAYAGVALPNDASVALHERLGFRELGTYVEVGRKFGRYWDVLWFERSLP
jgi:L-amino acid N-acyltransferase YncA